MCLFGCKEDIIMNNTFENLVGQRIKMIREIRNLTQDQLSAKMQTSGCDITRSALAKIEVGQRHLYPDEIKLFKEILKVNYSDILDIEYELEL